MIRPKLFGGFGLPTDLAPQARPIRSRRYNVARQEHVLTIFVASPGDVSDERTILEEVISELNITWSRDLGIRLDLVR